MIFVFLHHAMLTHPVKVHPLLSLLLPLLSLTLPLLSLLLRSPISIDPRVLSAAAFLLTELVCLLRRVRRFNLTVLGLRLA